MKTNANHPINPIFNSKGFPGYIPTIMPETESQQFSSGLSKREYFAAMAMQGYIAGGSFAAENLARASVSMADALIKELNKEK